MPKLTADEVLTQQHVRGFVSYGRPRPGTTPTYYGVQGGQYFFVTGVANPVSGGISPINVPDPQRRKAYKPVGRQIDPPDLGTFDLMVGHKHGAVPRALGTLGDCPVSVHLSAGRCKNPADLNRGYESYLYILASGLVTDRDNGDMFPQDSDEPLMTTLSITTAEQYAVGPLGFGEEATSEVNAEVLDIAFAPPRNCDGCDSGTSRLYAIARPIGASPNFQAEVIYSADGGATWAQANITGLGATAVPTAVDVVGDFLVVLVNSTNSLFYALIDADTGAPGTWTQVTSGFATGGNPRDLFVASPTLIFIVGDGGYIYRTRDITGGVTAISAGAATTQPLYRIHGADETLVAVGGNGTVVSSINGGATWATTQADPTNYTLEAVCVKDATHWWIGSGTGEGKVRYTLNGGKSWVEDTGAAPSAIGIQDIVFATEHVGYIAYTVAGPEGRLACTVDAGDSWVTGAARIAGSFPVHDRTNRIAVPASDAQTDANTVALAGLAGDGSEGVVYIGQANIL